MCILYSSLIFLYNFLDNYKFSRNAIRPNLVCTNCILESNFIEKSGKFTNPGDMPNNTPKYREYNIYIYTAVLRETSVSVNKIQDAMNLKIKKIFDDPREVAKSIKTDARKICSVSRTDALKTMWTYVEEQCKDKQNMRRLDVEYQIHEGNLKQCIRNMVEAYSVI